MRLVAWVQAAWIRPMFVSGHSLQIACRRQLRVGDLARFAGKPVLVLTGDRDTDHSRTEDAATANWLVTLGADVTFHFLDDPTYKGNGHIFMGEDNSDAIAELIIAWLDEGGG